MKKYAVFTKYNYVVQYQLSVSNKIKNTDGVVGVLKLANKWYQDVLHLPGVIKYKDGVGFYLCSSLGKYELNVIECDNNIKFNVATIEKDYEIREVD